jgi:hypothetical protein
MRSPHTFAFAPVFHTELDNLPEPLRMHFRQENRRPFHLPRFHDFVQIAPLRMTSYVWPGKNCR